MNERCSIIILNNVHFVGFLAVSHGGQCHGVLGALHGPRCAVERA